MDTILKIFYEGIKILSKVFEIWGFKVGDSDYDYNRDFPELKENFEIIIGAFQ
jgi:hypothetical protein